MSKGLAGVKTLTVKQIADKWKLPLAVVAKKVAAGVKVEKEHTTSTRQANEIARDHLGERPDYYDKLHKMEKTKIVKEDMTNVAGVTPRVSTQNIRQMVQGGRTPPSGTPNLQTITTPGGLTGTFSGNDAASKYAMDKQRHFDLNKNDGNFITSNAPRKDITSAADDMEARRQSGTLGQKDPEIEKTVRNYRYGVTNSDVTPSSMNSDITPSSKATPTTPGSYRTTPEIQKATDAIMNRKPGNDTESQKISNIQEESATGAVRGLGFVTGDPGVNPITQYINTNAMAYVDENGNKLDYIKKQHTNLHNSNLGYKAFDPTRIGANKNFMSESKLNELGEYENKNGTTDTEGLSDPHPKVLRKNIDINNIKEDLRKWFREKWVRYDTKGNIKGPCAREEGEGKPKCQPLASARAMSKKERAKSAKRKRREDPVADRSGKGGKPIMVKTNEETLLEKNVPTNPGLWARAKAQAKSKFDVYPSAYANGWASKWYKSKGGGWKTAANESIEEQSPANVSYKERPLYERGKVPADMSDATARGIYQEASADINEISDTLVGRANNAAFWKNRETSKIFREYVRRAQLRDPEENKKKEKEQRKKEVKEDANRPDRDLEARTYTGATGTTHTVKEETKMDNKELINEALDCILEDNLPEMKDNLMKALQEKAIEKLEERKKEIAANYFAQ